MKKVKVQNLFGGNQVWKKKKKVLCGTFTKEKISLVKFKQLFCKMFYVLFFQRCVGFLKRVS